MYLVSFNFRNGFLDVDGGYFAESRVFRLEFASPPLESPQELFEMVQPVVRSLWSCVVVVQVGDGEFIFFAEATAFFAHFLSGDCLTEGTIGG